MTELRDDPVRRPVEEPSGIMASRGAHAPPTGGGSRPSRRWMLGFVAVLVLVIVTATALAYVGISTVRTSRAGRIISTITDPAAPGFEALVEPSPTLVVFDTDATGSLQTAVVLSLNANDEGGSVLLVPRSTLGNGGAAALSLSAVYYFNHDPEVTREVLQDITTMGIAEAAVVDDARWAELVGPVAPLAIDNPTDLPGFPAGPVSLEADQVADWLHLTVPGQSELDALQRQELFWQAWVKAIAASTASAPVPGEVDSGLGRFAQGLSGGTMRVESLPVTPEPRPDGRVVFSSNPADARSVVNQLIPFPTGSAFVPRTKVRLLDGTGDAQHVGRVAPMLIPSDAELVVAGNADRFDYRTTEVRYHDAALKPQAEKLRAALGAGKLVEDPRPTEAFDVTIILGSDV